jgi:centrosomal protein POC5
MSEGREEQILVTVKSAIVTTSKEKNQVLNEMESLKELLHTYEQSIERKDQVISNLTHAMQKQREKIEMLKKFNEWKLKHIDRKREVSNYN